MPREIFQKTLERILIRCEGAVNFIDDILIFGADREEHDSRLNKVLDTLRTNGIMHLLSTKSRISWTRTFAQSSPTPEDIYQ